MAAGPPVACRRENKQKTENKQGMDMKRFLLAACVAMALTGTANAEMFFGSGLDLLRVCNSKAATSRNRCEGYVAGIADTLALGKPVGGYRACLPNSLSIDRMTRVVRAHLRKGRNHQLIPAWSLVASALAEAFPCRTR